VHIQREREAVLFGGDFMRLKEVVYSFTPGQGPLALDDGPTAMPIEPKGYNRTQELISAMTYSKAPSVTYLCLLALAQIRLDGLCGICFLLTLTDALLFFC